MKYMVTSKKMLALLFVMLLTKLIVHFFEVLNERKTDKVRVQKEHKVYLQDPNSGN
jgi:hypothetical protein